VVADPVLIDEVMLSLVGNAAQAMKGRGAITVSLRESGTHAVLEVADDGPGMTPEVLARATEAFFTTQPPGRAAGLGLTLAEEVARRSGGALLLRSTPGAGTTATLRIPLSRLELATATTSLEMQMVDPGRFGILVADPEGPSRRVIAQSLMRAGYRVYAVDDPQAALATLQESKVDVLIVGGRAETLVPAAREGRPTLGILRLCGLGEAPPDDEGSLSLERPVRLAQLMRSVRTLVTP